MKLIVGLGNPGEKYDKTRHNVGFRVLDLLSKDFKLEKKFNAEIAKEKIGEEDAILAEPQTFMNNSGEAVVKISSFYKIKPKDIWVIFDDIDLPLGKIRVREEGSSGGHKGVESIIKAIGSDFPRMRVGIGEKNIEIPSEDFVLQNFTADEEKIINKSIKESAEAIEFALNNNIKEVMNKYN